MNTILDPAPNRQRGMVLFIALIAMVIMTLGAIAIYRAVDSGTAVSGNIAFRQQGLAMTNRGIETAIEWLANPARNFNTDDPASGYYASQDMQLTNGDPASLDWTKYGRVTLTESGHEVKYVIHRLHVSTPCGDSTAGQTSATGENQGFSSGGEVRCYRVMVRSLGPRQAESIVQALVY